MKIKLKNVLIVSVILFGLVLNSRVLADPSDKYEEIKAKIEALSIDKCDKLSGQAKIDCIDKVIDEINKLKAELNKYAGEIGEKVTELQKDIQSLSNQISYLNANIEKTEIEIELKEKEISLLELDISKIEEEIKSKEKSIQEMKKRIAETIKSLYEYDSQNLVRLTLTQGSLSDFFDEVVYVNNLQESIGEALEQLKADKKVFELSKGTLLEREQATSKAKEELVGQISKLDYDKQQKSFLFEITKGDEEVYKKLLANIETQKKQLLGDLSYLSSLRSREIEEIVKRTGGRLCGVFKTIPYFAQDDSRWASVLIGGFPGVTMANYGCAVTSVAMVFNRYGISITPGQLAREDIFVCYGGNCGLIVWPSKWTPTNPKTKLVLNTADGGVDWSRIDSELNQSYPVILNIKLNDGSGREHFVVVVGKVNGKYWVYDPIYSVSQGCAVSLEASVANIREIYKASTRHDQMVIYHPY